MRYIETTLLALGAMVAGCVTQSPSPSPTPALTEGSQTGAPGAQNLPGVQEVSNDVAADPPSDPGPAPSSPAPEPVEQDEFEVKWAAIEKELATDISWLWKVKLITDFRASLPGEHALQKVTMSRWREESQVWKEANRAAQAASNALFLRGDLASIRDAVIADIERGSWYRWKYGEHPAVTLQLADDEGGTVDIPSRPMHVSYTNISNALGRLIYQNRRELLELDRKDRPALGRNHAVTELLKPSLRRPLYTAEGKLNRKALRKLLKGVWLRPDDRVLGAKARDIFALHSDSVQLAVKVYDAMIEKVGRKKALKEHRAALKKSGDDMPTFYREFAVSHDIGKAAGIDRPWKARGLVGFWLRRMNDGTDKMLYAYAQRILKSYGEK